MSGTISTMSITDTEQFIQFFSRYGNHKSVCDVSAGECNPTDIYLGRLLKKDTSSAHPFPSVSILCKEVLPNGQDGDEFYVLTIDAWAQCFDKLEVQVGDYVAFKGIKRISKTKTNFLLLEPHNEAKLWIGPQQKKNYERLEKQILQIPQASASSHNMSDSISSSLSIPLGQRSPQPKIPVLCHQEQQDSKTGINCNLKPRGHRSPQPKLPAHCAQEQQNTETDINCESEDIPLNVRWKSVKQLISWTILPTTKVKNVKVTKLQDINGDSNSTILCKVLSITQVSSRIHLLKLTDGTTVTSPVLIVNYDNSLEVRKTADKYVHVFVNEFSTYIEALQANDLVKIRNIEVKGFVIDNPDNNQSTWCLTFKLSGNNTRITECNFHERKQLLRLLKDESEATQDLSILNEDENNSQCSARSTTASPVPVMLPTSSKLKMSNFLDSTPPPTKESSAPHKAHLSEVSNPTLNSSIPKVKTCKRAENLQYEHHCQMCQSAIAGTKTIIPDFDSHPSRFNSISCFDRPQQIQSQHIIEDMQHLLEPIFISHGCNEINYEMLTQNCPLVDNQLVDSSQSESLPHDRFCNLQGNCSSPTVEKYSESKTVIEQSCSKVDTNFIRTFEKTDVSSVCNKSVHPSNFGVQNIVKDILPTEDKILLDCPRRKDMSSSDTEKKLDELPAPKRFKNTGSDFQDILNHQFSYTVQAWIKNFNPVSTSEFIKLVCISCKGFEIISDINDIKEKCEKCHSKGKTSSKLKVKFFVSLCLQDIRGNTIESIVCGENAEKFFGCSTADFLKSKSLQNDINNTLTALVNKCNQKDFSALAQIELLPVLSGSENFKLIVGTTLESIKQLAEV